MAYSGDYEQLWMFPFYPVARKPLQFLLNVFYLSDRPDGESFAVEVKGKKRRSEFIRYALELGAYLRLRGPYPPLSNDLKWLNGLRCQVCGAPADYYLRSPRTGRQWIWCKEDEFGWECGNLYGIVASFIDHDFGTSGRPVKATAAELENLAASPEIIVEEQNPAENKFIFTVNIRQKTAEETQEELEWLLGAYSVEELEGRLFPIIDFDLPPLEVGQNVVITPHFASSRLLALALVRLKQRLVVKILAIQPDGDYILLLPEGITIPRHSKPLSNKGQHTIVLSRSEIEPITSALPRRPEDDLAEIYGEQKDLEGFLLWLAEA